MTPAPDSFPWEIVLWGCGTAAAMFAQIIAYENGRDLRVFRAVETRHKVYFWLAVGTCAACAVGMAWIVSTRSPRTIPTSPPALLEKP